MIFKLAEVYSWEGPEPKNNWRKMRKVTLVEPDVIKTEWRTRDYEEQGNFWKTWKSSDGEQEKWNVEPVALVQKKNLVRG